MLAKSNIPPIPAPISVPTPGTTLPMAAPRAINLFSSSVLAKASPMPLSSFCATELKLPTKSIPAPTNDNIPEPLSNLGPMPLSILGILGILGILKFLALLSIFPGPFFLGFNISNILLDAPDIVTCIGLPDVPNLPKPNLPNTVFLSLPSPLIANPPPISAPSVDKTG